LAGAIYDPNRDELFSTHRGGGATCNNKKIRVSERANLDEAILALGFSKGKKTIDKCLELYQFYGGRVRKLRAMGSAALDLAYVSSGRLDAYIEQGVSIWDIAAGALMVEEAGGVVRSHSSEPEGKIHLVASNGKIPLEFV
jgi:myo-inositol-1(or 4)-monophosphatase